MAFRKRTGVWGSLLFGFCLAVGVEIAQIFIPHRQSSMIDVICDTLGTAFGIMAGMATRAPAIARNSGRVSDRGAALLSAAWVIWLLFPFVPLGAPPVIDWKAGIFAHSPAIALLPVISAAAVWYAAGILLQAAGVQSPRRWLLLSLVTIPLQVLMTDHLPVISEMAGGLAGVALYALRPRQWANRVAPRKHGSFCWP